MLNRIAYLALVLGLYAVAVAGMVGLVAWMFDRPFLEAAGNVWLAIVLFLGVAIYHGLRHDLS
ncbi:hypothetical protein [Citricoccus muralis]|uniref:Uncharacterized protein n=1 Tax=Citricoccus muralis TaxID=169134 RepID=A0ABY8H5B8_9MICC|nr:hypothetical protein [Citricoccus muralis]WFP16136.1 hypothetical protein P8192_12175 [Citricoccus muralis]